MIAVKIREGLIPSPAGQEPVEDEGDSSISRSNNTSDNDEGSPVSVGVTLAEEDDLLVGPLWISIEH